MVIAVGVPTVGVVVAVCVDATGPLQPAALAVIIEDPLQPATKVTDPVPGSIVFPPAMLAASREYVIPVVFVAVAP